MKLVLLSSLLQLQQQQQKPEERLSTILRFSQFTTHTTQHTTRIIRLGKAAVLALFTWMNPRVPTNLTTDPNELFELLGGNQETLYRDKSKLSCPLCATGILKAANQVSRYRDAKTLSFTLASNGATIIIGRKWERSRREGKKR